MNYYLTKIISGGQTGVDRAGLEAARVTGIETGGWAPKGFRTLNGNDLSLRDLYNLKEIDSYSYAARTELNVLHSDGTIRIAKNFFSPGELCTLKNIKLHNKPYFDIPVKDEMIPYRLISDWLIHNNISTLNVAGNAEQTYNGIGKKAYYYLKGLFKLIKSNYVVKLIKIQEDTEFPCINKLKELLPYDQVVILKDIDKLISDYLMTIVHSLNCFNINVDFSNEAIFIEIVSETRNKIALARYAKT